MLQSFFPSRAIRIAVLGLLFVGAFAIRMYDLTDLPLEFHPTRQLLSAIKARALYYQTQPDGISTEKLETAIEQAKRKAEVEPVIFERVVAFTYRFTGEQVWIARIYSSLFWLIGGVFLFLLIRDMASFDAAVLPVSYYLFFPYAIIASRSFQPDSLMVMMMLIFLWVFWRWTHSLTWSNTLLAGLIGGLAIFIKFSVAFFVLGAALGLALSRFTLRDLLRNKQVWLMAVLGILPSFIYLGQILIAEDGLGGQFTTGRFIPALLLSPSNYLQWMTKANLAAGGVFIMLGMLGLFLATGKPLRTFMIGLWGGYLLYGLYFNYLVATHDYYHLPFIPIVAISLSPLGGWFFARLTESTVHSWQRSAAYVILVAGMFMVTWNVRNQMKAADYRPNAAMWAEIGELVYDKRVVALTEDYGSRLEYWGWKTPQTWPSQGEVAHSLLRGGKINSFDEMFAKYTEKRDVFLVTDLDEFRAQLQLREKLLSYSVYAEGDGYIIYSLR